MCVSRLEVNSSRLIGQIPSGWVVLGPDRLKEAIHPHRKDYSGEDRAHRVSRVLN